MLAATLLGIVLFAALPLAVWTGAASPAAQDPAPPVDFTTQIRPLLSDRCFRCHGPDASSRKAELRLDVKEGALKRLQAGWWVVKPHDPSRSELLRRVTTDEIEEMMPPPDSKLSLRDDEKELLRRWIEQGADYRPHWSLAAVRAPTPPVRPGDAASHPVDAFVRARLAREGLTGAPRASPEALIRRLSLGLTGLPPSPDELDAFVGNPSAKAYGGLVEQYLDSPAYGERMAMDWLDLARYADTYGYQADVERDMSPYRDWVISAFNRNLGYDQFLTWQLAGDLLPGATPEQRIATAFNRLHRQTNEGGSIDEEFRVEYVADRVNTFGTAMLGLTLECARCHDHRFDPVSQSDYYSLSAFFNNIDESGLYSHYTAATPSPAMLLWPQGKEQEHRRLTARLRQLESRLRDMTRAARRQPGPPAAVALPRPVAHLPFDKTAADQTPDIASGFPAELKDGPALEEVEPGRTAIRFSGDNSVVHPALPTFRRTDPFSILVQLQPTERQERALVLHQSRAWSDAGSRGFELTLEDGRVFFALVHFWPGNAIAVRSRTPLPLAQWSQLAITYDGSSRAAGIGLYLNGRPLAADVVRDHLYKDITYDKSAGDNVSEQPRFTLGARFRDSGFKNGLIEDLRVFGTALTGAEVATAAGLEPSAAQRGVHTLIRHSGPYKTLSQEVRQMRLAENALLATVPELMVMKEMATPRPSHRLERGAYDAPRERVLRDTPAALPPFPAGQPRNRLGLARWVTSRRNPLASRVVVNRIWRMHFGRGLVATQEDFGSQGRLPSHPELLDYLASRFVASGWDVKALHRLIVTSETFQQSSRASAALIERDPENELLARGPKRRLPAEMIRDSALAASGLLTRTVGGHSVRPYQPAGLWEQAGTGKTYRQDTGAALYRRSLYTFWKRTLPPPSMVTFDAVSREVCSAKREVTTTPLQSLVLLNDPQFVEAARHLATRAITTAEGDPARAADAAFRALIGRRPQPAELAILRRAWDEQRALFAAHPEDARRLLTVGESPASNAVPAVELAAMTVVVSTIMNFDEFVVLR